MGLSTKWEQGKDHSRAGPCMEAIFGELSLVSSQPQREGVNWREVLSSSHRVFCDFFFFLTSQRQKNIHQTQAATTTTFSGSTPVAMTPRLSGSIHVTMTLASWRQNGLSHIKLMLFWKQCSCIWSLSLPRRFQQPPYIGYNTYTVLITVQALLRKWYNHYL